MPKRPSRSIPAPPGRNDLPLYRRPAFLLLVLFLVGLGVRLPLLAQSLWYDEMYTLLHFVLQPWSDALAGAYSPNNHVLFTLLAKGCTTIFSEANPATAARAPSLFAGAAAPVVLAMWLQRLLDHDKSRGGGAAWILALLVALNPWLVAFSGWARGYALLLFLALAATALLERGRSLAYAVAMAAAIYTHPIAIAFVPAHGAVVGLKMSRMTLQRWAMATVLAGGVAGLLYLPFLLGARQYWSAPERPSITYGEFVAGSLRNVVAGQDAGGIVSMLVAAVACAGGGILAWRITPLRPLVLTFAVATLFALAVPLLVPTAGETRAALWLIPLYSAGLLGVFVLAWQPGWIRWAGAISAGTWLLVTALHLRALYATPAQPIAEAIIAARQVAADSGGPVIGVYMASAEARSVYGGIDRLAYILAPDGKSGLPSLLEAEGAYRGQRPALVIFYEPFLRRDQPALWSYLQQHYAPVRRLPGRISAATIYARSAPVGG